MPSLTSPWRVSRARLLVLPALLCSLGSVPFGVPRVTTQPMSVSLFEFNRADEADWEVVNDGVMGGRSAGFVAVEDGTLRFTGTLVTQGGGFASIRARRTVDLSGHNGLELRVRGGGRQFELEVDDGLRRNGRSVSRRSPFPSATEWTVVRVPFRALRSSIFGQAVNTPPLDVTRIRAIGLYMADAQDGAFRLEVDYVRAYSDSAP